MPTECSFHFISVIVDLFIKPTKRTSNHNKFFRIPSEVSEPTQSDARRESASETFVRDKFRNELTQWQGGINRSYADVFLPEDLTPEAFDSLFPTEASRKELQARQRQMQADIANRVQRFLSYNTPGSRDEKLSIIREALTENWGADLAKSVLEQLDSDEDRKP